MQDVYVINTKLMALHLSRRFGAPVPFHQWKHYKKEVKQFVWDHYTPPFREWLELTPAESEDLRNNYLAPQAAQV